MGTERSSVVAGPASVVGRRSSVVRRHYAWLVVVLGCVTLASGVAFPRYGYSFLLPTMKEALHLSYAESGVLASVNYLGFMAFSVAGGGFLASRFGIRRTASTGLFIASACMSLIGLASSFGHVLLVQFIAGCAGGAAAVSVMSLPASWFSASKRGFAAGAIAAGYGVALLVTGSAAPEILLRFGENGWRLLWFVLSAATVVVGLLAAILLRDSPAERRQTPFGGESLQEPASPGGRPALGRTPFTAWKQVWGLPVVRYLFAYAFMQGLAYGMFITFFAAHVQQRGLPVSLTGQLWVVNGVLALFAAAIWGMISDRFGRRQALVGAILFQGVGYSLFAAAFSPVQFYTTVILIGMSSGSGISLLAATLGDFVDRPLLPAAIGLANAFPLGVVVGPSFAGLIADHTGTFVIPLLVSTGLAAGAAAMGILMPRRPTMDEGRTPDDG